MGKDPKRWDFRDVSSGIQAVRQFLLGRKNVFHQRFLPLLAPRSIPPPDVPRGPEYKYADQWYGSRDLLNSVKPPVVAPHIAQNFKPAAKPSPCYPQQPSTGESFKFPSELPIPGCVWWFDAHCYYKEVSQYPCGPPPCVPSAPRPISPCAPGAPPSTPPCPCPPPEIERPVVRVDPCGDAPPPCKIDPCKAEKITPVRPPEICDPCKNEEPKKKC